MCYYNFIVLDYTDSEILLAILNQHTLNPVLATVANVVLECTNRYEKSCNSLNNGFMLISGALESYFDQWHVGLACVWLYIIYCIGNADNVLLIPTHMLQNTAWKN